MPCTCNKVRSCKECQTRYNREWFRRNKQAQTARVKANTERYRQEARDLIRDAKNVPCADCGRSYHWFAMDFDHRLDKEIDVSAAVRKCWTVERIKTEITKCDVVCATCHRLRTVRRIESGETTWNTSPSSSVDRAPVS